MTTATDDLRRNTSPRTIPGALGWIAGTCVLLAVAAQAVLEDQQLASAFVSRSLWLRIIESLHGVVESVEGQPLFASLPLGGVAGCVGGGAAVTWLAGALVIGKFSGRPWRTAAAEWGSRGWKWWSLAGIWYLLWLVALVAESQPLSLLMTASTELWFSVALGGWLLEFVSLLTRKEQQTSMPRALGWTAVGTAIVVYTTVFVWMNWQLYHGLLVPHGDSAMYEEHLWNITHGKGFRSYLDQGLFLGEHIQFIHLGLLPGYLIWPSHLLLEFCESLSLAMTAVPLYTIALRHTQSQRAAAWMAIAVLLYFPMQYLDIAIDLKTFRPISFGVPLLLLAVDQLERRRWKTMTVLLLLTLTAKEDYAIVIAPLGVWLAVSSWSCRRRIKRSASHPDEVSQDRSAMIVGTTMSVLSTLYLVLAVKVLIPWFRDGETVHYARYFSRFGETPTEIVLSMLTDPGLLLGEFLTVGTIMYGLRLIVPLGGTPLLSPSRLCVGAPLFLLLCLNELAQETPAPVHHFHAPLLPILFWSAAAGLPNIARLSQTIHSRFGRLPSLSPLRAARFACLCALATGMLTSIHPLSRKFWDSGSAMYWRRLYVPGERAEQFARILPLIPPDTRVASTDFVHPRFTHYERSYDYSGYRRKVSDYERRVPDDTEYIVIDTRHPYSTMHTPADVPEFHQGDEWELLTPESAPWFIVLRRRHSASSPENPQP